MRLVAPDPADDDAGHHGSGALASGLGRDRPGRRRPQRRRAGAPGGPGRAVRGGQGRTATGTAARRWRGPRWPAVRGRLAVALVDEGVELRQHGIDRAGPAAERVRAPMPPTTALAYGLTPTLYCTRRSRRSPPRRAATGRRTAVHVKVDTGMHRVGAAPEDLPRHRGGRGRRARCWPGGRSGPTCRWPTVSQAEDRAYTEGQLDLFDRLAAGLAGPGVPGAPCCTPPTRPAPSPSHGPPRHGALRPRPLRVPAGARRARAPSARSRRRPAAPGDVAEGPRDRRAHARGRGAPLLRPAPPTAGALAGGHGAHRLRRRRAPRPVRRRLRGAHRRRAPAPGRAW